MHNSNEKTTMGVEVRSDGHAKKLTARMEGHVPFNKARWQVHRCTAILEIDDYDGKKPDANKQPWMNIVLREFEEYESGRQRETTISVTLYDDDRKRLIEMLGGRL